MKTFAAQKPVSARSRIATPVPISAPRRSAQRARIRQILHGPCVQTKLTIGPDNDKYEREADRVADQVMRMPDPNLFRKPT